MMSAADVPRLTELARRVHLSTLGLTEPGDIFYLAQDPGTVWFRDAPEEGYVFTQLANESWWYRLANVGDGTPGQTVVVLHNTRKFVTN